MYMENPFLADEIRTLLAQEGKLDDLLMSYDGRMNDLPDISTAKLWDFKAKVMLKTFHEKEMRFRHVMQMLERGRQVLDWGIGSGEIFRELRDEDRKNYVGIDVSEELVMQMSKRFPDGQFRKAGLHDIQSGAFFHVCALEVLEHIQARQLPKTLADINRIIVSGGSIICSVPLYEELRFMTISCPHCGSLANKEGHCRSYTPELIVAELKLAGFEVIDQRYVWQSYRHPVLRVREGIKRLIGYAKPVNIVIKAKKVSDTPAFASYR